MDQSLIVVYGTLKQGYHNHRLLEHPSVTFLGEIVTEPQFTMLNHGGFPAVMVGGTTPIKGEVYAIKNKEILNNIYSLEGYTGVRDHPNNWYDTLAIQTDWGLAEMFIFKNNNLNLPVVETGEWI